MTHLRNFFAATVLTFILAGAALADDGIIYGGFMPTPTPTPVAQMSNSSAGDLPVATAPPSDEVTVTDIAIESVLRVLGGLSLL